jgi:hypothetical protein
MGNPRCPSRSIPLCRQSALHKRSKRRPNCRPRTSSWPRRRLLSQRRVHQGIRLLFFRVVRTPRRLHPLEPVRQLPEQRPATRGGSWGVSGSAEVTTRVHARGLQRWCCVLESWCIPRGGGALLKRACHARWPGWYRWSGRGDKE